MTRNIVVNFISYVILLAALAVLLMAFGGLEVGQ